MEMGHHRRIGRPGQRAFRLRRRLVSGPPADPLGRAGTTEILCHFRGGDPPLSLVSAGVYLTKGGLDLGGALPYLAGGALGGILSGLCFRRVSLTFLRRAFGALILYGGIRAVLAL